MGPYWVPISKLRGPYQLGDSVIDIVDIVDIIDIIDIVEIVDIVDIVDNVGIIDTVDIFSNLEQCYALIEAISKTLVT